METVSKIDKAARLLEFLNYEFGILTAWFYFKAAHFSANNLWEPDQFYSKLLGAERVSFVLLLICGIGALVLMIFAGVCASRRKYKLVILLNEISYFVSPPSGLLAILALVLATHALYEKEKARGATFFKRLK